jgi:hypothetical protein
VPTTKECESELPEVEGKHTSRNERIEEMAKGRLIDDMEGEDLDRRDGLAPVAANFDIEPPECWGTFREGCKDRRVGAVRACVLKTAIPGGAGAVVGNDAGACSDAGGIAEGKWLSSGGEVGEGTKLTTADTSCVLSLVGANARRRI